MSVFLVMMLGIISPNGDVLDIKVKSIQAQSMVECVSVMKSFPERVVEAEDGTMIINYFVCKQEL
jgi:hypothetical protein